jgi:class 3 adenylate cyclase/tetratricopeptide (TPR) repeat protein
VSTQVCTACGAGNPAGALYCARCGKAQGRPCLACGAVVGLEAAFCTACGTALEPPPAATPAEERKIVSVLFADLVGFTSRTERLDPEDVRGLLAPYHARVRTELERFSGTVEKFIGDAIVALFGAPVAHEDDPERAVRAALAVREAIGELNEADPALALQVRIGITTGEALVTRDARPSEGEGMAAGDVVNTAARLQVAAPVDGILVDKATYSATKDAIEYQAVEAVAAKGKTEPVPAWKVVAPRARRGVDIPFRGGAPLIGRDGELDSLRDAFARARRERTAQLATLVGVPGIGKSRLVYELAAEVDADPDLYAFWRQGRSLPYGNGVSFWALGEMAKSHAGILESDDTDTAEEKVRAAVAHAVKEPAEVQWVEAHLRPLVGLGGEAGSTERRGEAFAAWRRLFEAVAEEHPLVLVFEDVHWADDGLLDFVDHLVEWVTDAPLFVLCTARPELLERRPGWGGGKRNSVTISLSPLSDEDTTRLLGELLGGSDSELVASAGGNPLYAEEYARMVAQRDNGDDLPLPDSVQGIIAARLDTLPLEEKALVQDASVLGKTFWEGELAHVAGSSPTALVERLHALERKEFIRRERRSSVAAETAFVFRHVLVRDVAYTQMPRARRAEKHRRAAEWIEALAGDRREDLADMVAHHYSSALELARSAGQDAKELAQRARLALRDAGDRAARLSAFAEAVRFYREALELWPEDDPERPRLLFAYGRALFYSEDRGAEVLAEAAEELLDTGDRECAAEAQTIIGELHWIQGRHGAAFEHFRGAVALLDDEAPARAKVHTLATLARFLMVADAHEEAIATGSSALRMAEELGLEELRPALLNTVGVARVARGDLAGLEDLERSVALSEGLNSFDAVRAYNNLASTLSALGDLDRAFVLYREGLKRAQRFGRPLSIAWLRVELADELYCRGAWDEAVALCDELLAESEDGEHYIFQSSARVIRGGISLARGDLAQATDDAARATAFARETHEPQHVFPALALLARTVVESGESEQGSRLFDELLERWRTSPGTFASSWVANAAPAAQACGRGPDLVAAAKGVSVQTRWLEAAVAYASGDFLRAARLYARIGSQPDEAHARLQAAEDLVRTGRRDEADAELSHALEFYRRVGAARMVREAEALLASA